MGSLRTRMQEDMILGGYSPSTIKNYLHYAHKFSEFHMTSPVQMGEEEVREFLLYYLNERSVSGSTYREIRAALSFLYKVTMKREICITHFPVSRQRKKLPVVLSGTEITSILGKVKNLKHATTLKTIYSAGLRITEACKLRVTDIDSKRMLIRVQDPKGKRDRYTILSERLLKALRKYWIECRPESNDDFLFPSRGKAGYVTPEMIRKTFKKAMAAAGVTKKTSTHSLRHSFATHMLETGTDIRVIQALLGHRSIRVTGVYTHVSLAHLSRTTSPFDILGTPEASVMG